MKRKGLLFVLLLFLGACSDNHPQLTPLPKEAVIVALGDSLTKGVGAPLGFNYPDVLSRMIKRRVVNAGVSGDTTKEGLNRLPGLIEQYHPSLVIVSLGGNDLLRRVPKAHMEAHLKAIIELLKKDKIEILLLAPPKPNLTLSAPAFYKALGDKYHIIVNTQLLPSLLSTKAYKSDNIHLNKQGYKQLAEGINKILKERGALEEA